MNTYWVDYSYSFEYKDPEDEEWYEYEGGDGGRFQCKKRDIKKEVEKQVIFDEAFKPDEYRNLKIIINDYYITTDCEV